MLQVFLVDLVDIGLMNAREAGNRRRLSAVITQLADAISKGLVIDTGTGDQTASFEATAMRQCTAGAADVGADCSDGTVLADSTTQPPIISDANINANSQILIIATAVIILFTIF